MMEQLTPPEPVATGMEALEVWLESKSSTLIGKPLLSLSATDCKYPVSTDTYGRHLFCSKPSQWHQGKPSPYCQVHNRVCYAGSAPKAKLVKVLDWGGAR